MTVDVHGRLQRVPERGTPVAVAASQGPVRHRARDAPSVPASPTRFRPDIQGLRAVAVTIVVLNHAGLSWLSGGYVGVDVFFVISGYLITQLLLRDAFEHRCISLGRFYSRRARRILPAATVVLVATTLSSVALLGYVRAKSILTDEVWSAFFAANIHFSQVGTDYFSADAPPSPVQHFWSLAVEEQFYLVWPLVLIAVLALWNGRSRSDRAVTGVLGVVGAASLAWCVLLTGREQTAAYFSTTARAWELALGAGCAVLATRVARWPTVVGAPLGWLGLAMIVLASLFYTDLTRFPGYAALLPTIGAALVVIGGEGSGRGGPSSFLSSAPFRRVGDWSYSLYLWHWPILILAAGYVGHSLAVSQNLMLVGVAVVVSAFTYGLVENPFRRSPVLGKGVWRGIVIYPLATAVTLVAVGVGNAMINREVVAASRAPAIDVSAYEGELGGQSAVSKNPAIALVQASVEAARTGAPIPGHLQPELLGLAKDIPSVGECDYTTNTHQLCPRGDTTSDQVMVALGDSHARAWIPALQKIAKHAHLKAYYLVKPGCNAAMILQVDAGGSAGFTACVDWRNWAISEIQQLQPRLVFIASDLPPAYIDPSDGQYIDDPAKVADAVQQGLVRTLDALAPSAGDVYVAGDPPGLPQDPGDCLSRRGADLGDCSFRRTSQSRLIYAAQRVAAEMAGVHFINTLPWFCADGLCPSVVGSTLTFRDTGHITPEYAAELAKPLQAEMRLGSTARDASGN